jgi:hypothetical protein
MPLKSTSSKRRLDPMADGDECHSSVVNLVGIKQAELFDAETIVVA